MSDCVYVKYPYHGIVRMTKEQYENLKRLQAFMKENEADAIKAMNIEAKIMEAEFFADDLKDKGLEDFANALGLGEFAYVVITNAERKDGEEDCYKDFHTSVLKRDFPDYELARDYFHNAVERSKDGKGEIRIRFLMSWNDCYNSIEWGWWDIRIADGEIKTKDVSEEKDYLSDKFVEDIIAFIKKIAEVKFEHYATDEEFDALCRRLDDYKAHAEQHEFPRLLIADSLIEKAKANPNDGYARNKAMYEILLNVFHEEEEAKRYIKEKK